ncbi:MAG: ATP-binding protein [Brevinematia bacterium]
MITGNEEKIIAFEKELLAILEKTFSQNDLTSHEIHFCVHEAILNIIQHTYKWDTSLPIDIQINITEEEEKKIVEIYIKDTGKPIKKEIHPPHSIKSFQMRQRGLYMISKIMDDFYIKPVNKSGNLSYMKKIVLKK